MNYQAFRDQLNQMNIEIHSVQFYFILNKLVYLNRKIYIELWIRNSATKKIFVKNNFKPIL